MDTYATIATGMSVLNVVLLVGLIYLYGRVASKTHAGFSYGLLGFSGLLLAQNSGMVYVCGFLTDYSYNSTLSTYFAALSILEFAGLLILLRVTL